MSDGVPVTCGYCGEELDDLGSDHVCREGIEIWAFVATGDPEVFSDD